ncbi:YdcF family protein [Undibacterium fentianense]|uniref:YdcF family protein n=1 Tax=Undibacterium fentianense TaxID=2828728 RepID=A0A941E0X4_9BURK|nr:YdcF family protein [Undibacterium fentianense]MBR7800330.1 YdcF family protein [Undibacterium fentianense]
MINLNAAEIECVNRFMFVPSQVLNADATIVFGMSLWQRPAQMASNLYHRSTSGKLVLSGGYNHKIDMHEANAMYQVLLAADVPKQDILLDLEARNTRENIQNAKRILEDSEMYKSDLILNIVAINFHVRRILLTLEEEFGRDISVGIASYPSIYCAPETWHVSEQGQANMLGELNKIRRYVRSDLPKMLAEIALRYAQQSKI